MEYPVVVVKSQAEFDVLPAKFETYTVIRIEAEASLKITVARRTTLTHPSWSPAAQECGGGKFHACATPYLADEFRSTHGDRYVAIRVAVSDLHAWLKNPEYPHKIAFRSGTVLCEVDRYGQAVQP